MDYYLVRSMKGEYYCRTWETLSLGPREREEGASRSLGVRLVPGLALVGELLVVDRGVLVCGAICSQWS